MRSGIVIHNNLRAFMTDVDPDVVLAREFSKYPNIVPAHLLDEESEAGELFVGQQFDVKKDCLHAIKQYNLKLSVDYKATKLMQYLYVGECWKALSGCNWHVRL
ncbi:hypothetical protein PVK06_047230 [Gossypium arboreum]|uniref:Uncharacterized protein n=1 Tax=Gossypium arboreum TaxID=29729 RepID=A0ABR0MD28_GOSAR|nr:hypothetical protein PVK06_047230 [Gossypium arboreum]